MKRSNELTAFVGSSKASAHDTAEAAYQSRRRSLLRELELDEKAGALPDALDRLKRRPGLLEGMILSTCNRVEVAVTADEESGAEESVEHFLVRLWARCGELKIRTPQIRRFHRGVDGG